MEHIVWSGVSLAISAPLGQHPWLAKTMGVANYFYDFGNLICSCRTIGNGESMMTTQIQTKKNASIRFWKRVATSRLHVRLLIQGKVALLCDDVMFVKRPKNRFSSEDTFIWPLKLSRREFYFHLDKSRVGKVLENEGFVYIYIHGTKAGHIYMLLWQINCHFAQHSPLSYISVQLFT